MRFAKYNDYSGVSQTVIAPGGGSSSGSSSLNRTLWGNEDTGGNIGEDIFVAGSIYMSQNDINEDAEDDDDLGTRSYETRADDDGGNIFMDNGTLYSKAVKYEYQGTPNVDLDTHQKKQDDDIEDHETRISYVESLFPIGSILMYAGNITIPAGWHICDGTEGTVDLRKKFVRGAESVDKVGANGGNETVTLSTSNMPNHSHTASTTVTLSKSESSAVVPDNLKDQIISTQKETFYQVFDMGGDKHWTLESGYEDATDKGVIEITVGELVDMATGGSIDYTASASTTIGSTGSGSSFDILPPYYDLIYIQRIS